MSEMGEGITPSNVVAAEQRPDGFPVGVAQQPPSDKQLLLAPAVSTSFAQSLHPEQPGEQQPIPTRSAVKFTLRGGAVHMRGIYPIPGDENSEERLPTMEELRHKLQDEYGGMVETVEIIPPRAIPLKDEPDLTAKILQAVHPDHPISYNTHPHDAFSQTPNQQQYGGDNSPETPATSPSDPHNAPPAAQPRNLLARLFSGRGIQPRAKDAEVVSAPHKITSGATETFTVTADQPLHIALGGDTDRYPSLTISIQDGRYFIFDSSTGKTTQLREYDHYHVGRTTPSRPDNHPVIPVLKAKVSRDHLEFYVREGADGNLLVNVKDSSTNGTYTNTEPTPEVTSKRSVALEQIMSIEDPEEIINILVSPEMQMVNDRMIFTVNETRIDLSSYAALQLIRLCRQQLLQQNRHLITRFDKAVARMRENGRIGYYLDIDQILHSTREERIGYTLSTPTTLRTFDDVKRFNQDLFGGGGKNVIKATLDIDTTNGNRPIILAGNDTIQVDPKAFFLCGALAQVGSSDTNVRMRYLDPQSLNIYEFSILNQRNITSPLSLDLYDSLMTQAFEQIDDEEKGIVGSAYLQIEDYCERVDLGPHTTIIGLDSGKHLHIRQAATRAAIRDRQNV